MAALLVLVAALVYLGLGARRMEALCTTDGFQADHFRAETVGESVRHGFSLAPPGFTCSRGGESTVMLIPRD